MQPYKRKQTDKKIDVLSNWQSSAAAAAIAGRGQAANKIAQRAARVLLLHFQSVCGLYDCHRGIRRWAATEKRSMPVMVCSAGLPSPLLLHLLFLLFLQPSLLQLQQCQPQAR